MASRNFVWGLEQCFDYVTSSSDFRLSNGTNMMAVARLEEIGHAFFKKRPPHLGFESYFSIFRDPIGIYGRASKRRRFHIPDQLFFLKIQSDFRGIHFQRRSFPYEV